MIVSKELLNIMGIYDYWTRENTSDSIIFKKRFLLDPTSVHKVKEITIIVSGEPKNWHVRTIMNFELLNSYSKDFTNVKNAMRYATRMMIRYDGYR